MAQTEVCATKMISPERWKKVEEIFQSALDLPERERTEYVQRACENDPDLAQEITKLLNQYEAAGDSFEESILYQPGAALLPIEAEENDPMLGQRLGAYQIDKEIGRGGMGSVYLASRADNIFQRRVAIKIIRPGLDSQFILQRFRHERQMLANLNHPNIARLLDGGATLRGQPYFVMEYIEGLSLYAYCDSNRLGIHRRLELFVDICSAIDYAHQNRIIHRDIKPSNILVSRNGVPKLFDFGIAKLLNPDPSYEHTPQTATAMRLMTVEYASPEQVQGLPITPLTDIYSLGVLLYELLSGHRPYHFGSRLPYEMARVISEEEPEFPSIAVAESDRILPIQDLETVTPRDVWARRNATLETLRKELSGTLDNIILKALRKEPAERYPSAAALRDDLESCLAGRPVSARVSRVPKKIEPQRSTRLPESTTKSIAVLPLKILNLNKKADTSDNFLSVGLADAMIMRLSGVRSLAVRATSAVLRYGGETSDPVQSGRELGVDFVLDGRIKIAGDRIRVSLQLLDVSRHTSIWADQFDEQFIDALELEDSISEKVVGALLSSLTRDEQPKVKKRGTENAESFDAYLRGRFFWNKFTPESLPKALESFERAVALDPNHAAAYVGLADFYNWAGIYGILPAQECHRLAREAAQRALRIDPSFAEAYAALALTTESADWAWVECERLYTHALELNPNFSLAHEWYSSLLIGTGRFDEGIREIRRAEELDRLSPRAMTLTAWSYYQVRSFGESLKKARQIIELDKNYPQGHLQLGISLVQLGQAEEGIRAIQRAAGLMPDSALPKYELCYALMAADRGDSARGILSEINELASRQYVKPYFLGMAYAALEERENAFRWLEAAFAEHDPWLIWFGTEPKLDPLRKDRRFIELFNLTNNPIITGRSNTIRTEERF